MKGFAGQQLRVDLNTWETRTERVSEELARQYMGGSGYGANPL